MSASFVAEDIHKRPGKVFVEPVRHVGRKRNFGSLCSVQGQMAICLGYTPDGMHAVYIPLRHAEAVRARARAANRSMLYRILKRLVQHYERQHA